MMCHFCSTLVCFHLTNKLAWGGVAYRENIGRHVLSLWDPPFELPLNLIEKINFTKGGRCWWLTYIIAGAHLNPYLLGEAHLYDDANAKEDLNRVL
jgi:hypothetical protein